MVLFILSLCAGLALLVWSADKFVEGSASVARHFSMPPLLIGMVIIGFGTSAPELAVSLLAAIQNNQGIVLGNAYGSNIANIALILGLSSLISPISVHSSVLRKELPVLSLVTLISFFLIRDLKLSRADSLILVLIFSGLIAWTIVTAKRNQQDSLGKEIDEELTSRKKSLSKSLFWLFTGLVLLIGSSRVLVWSAVEIAKRLGLNDLVIGLTIIAVGTSLPELASSILASKKGEHDLALGNILGSNLFNTLFVVGLAGVVNPFSLRIEIIRRDVPVMILLTLSIFIIGYGFKGRQGRINRLEGSLLLLFYFIYTIFLFI